MLLARLCFVVAVTLMVKPWYWKEDLVGESRPTYKMEVSLELIYSISSYSILPVTTTGQP
jgi:hypothetical protein